MTIKATYALNDYLKTIMNPLTTPAVMEFDPGSPGAASSDTTFCTYKVVQNRDYDQPYIHMDAVTINVYHTSVDTLQKLIDRILSRLNNETVYDNTALVAAGLADGVKFLDVIARAANHTQNDFIDSTEYHMVVVDIMMEYIVLPTYSGEQFNAYVEGTV